MPIPIQFRNFAIRRETHSRYLSGKNYNLYDKSYTPNHPDLGFVFYAHPIASAHILIRIILSPS